MFGLREFRDVPAGVLESDDLATARQRYWIIKPSFPTTLSHWRAGPGAASAHPRCTRRYFSSQPPVCREAGFCHEGLFMSDSAMPTGCAGGLAGARRVSSVTSHVGPLLSSGFVFRASFRLYPRDLPSEGCEDRDGLWLIPRLRLSFF
jgi:hypothetical protein